MVENAKIKVKARFDARRRSERGGRVRRGGYGKKETKVNLTYPLSCTIPKVVVRCKTSYTGLFSFLAIPLLMGDIMIEFMNMIDINSRTKPLFCDPLFTHSIPQLKS